MLKLFSTIAQLYSNTELGRFVSTDFIFVWAKLLGARYACECGSVVNLPLNCTYMLHVAHSEISSTRGKYSRKYGIHIIVCVCIKLVAL